MSANPVKDVIDELSREFKLMNADCQMLTEEVNALHKHISKSIHLCIIILYVYTCIHTHLHIILCIHVYIDIFMYNMK